MIKKVLLSLLVLFCYTTVIAQTFDWAKSMGNSGIDEGASIALDNIGNIYTLGVFTGTVDFDPNSGVYNLSSNLGSKDIFIQKLDPNGNLIWAKHMGGGGGDEGKSIFIDNFGNVFSIGTFHGTVDFDPGIGVTNLISQGNSDIYIQKLDSDGNFIWAKSIGTSVNEYGVSITVDSSGNVYSTGIFYGITDFDPNVGIYNLSAIGNYSDVYILKLDMDGNFIWAKRVGGNSIDHAKSIKLNSLGEIYISGYFRLTVDFNPNAGVNNQSSNGDSDIFLLKLDTDGNFIWVKSFGGIQQDVITSMVLDGMDNVYLAGNFRSTVDFDPNAGVVNYTSIGNRDIFIEKLDLDGNFSWVNTIGTIGNEYGPLLAVDFLNNIYSTGHYSTTLDFDPSANDYSLTVEGYNDSFLQKFDSDGNFQWVTSIRGSNFVEGQAVAVDDSLNIYSTGFFVSTVDINPNSGILLMTSNGSYDIFVQKLSTCITNTNWTDTQTACNSYTWIDGNTYTSSNSTATYTLTNSIGCDSIITLDLSIPLIDTSITIVGNVLMSNQNGVDYQWVDCNDNYSPINGETNIDFIATQNGRYAVILTSGNCSDTSTCVNIFDVNLEQNSFEEGINIYPNPILNELHINLENYEKSDLFLTNISGQILYSNLNLNKENITIPFNSMSPGVYYLRIHCSDQYKVIKIVKL